MRQRFGVVGICLAFLCGLFSSPSLATPTVGKPVASLSVIPGGQPTTLTVTSTITSLKSDPALIPNSVTLLLARGDGVKSTTQTVGIMHDDGLAGDTVAGDKIFTLQFTVTEATPGEMRLQVSAALQKELKRRLSGVTTVPIDTLPVANAGPNQTVPIGTAVTLDGSASSDLDGDDLTFQWTFLSKPANSTAALSSPTAVQPTFQTCFRKNQLLPSCAFKGRTNRILTDKY